MPARLSLLHQQFQTEFHWIDHESTLICYRIVSAINHLMSSVPRRQGDNVSVVPPSRTISRRRAADSQVPTTPIRQANKRGDSWSGDDPLLHSPTLHHDLFLSIDRGEQRQDVAFEDSENASLRIRHESIEVAVDALEAGDMGVRSFCCPTDSTSPSQSVSSNSSASNHKFPTTPTLSELEPCTRLHSICELTRASEILVYAPQHLSATNIAALDAYGRTPLHIISENSSLGSFDDSQMMCFIIESLWKGCPSAISSTDKNGLIPFQVALQDWIQEELQLDKNINNGLKPSLVSRTKLWNLLKTPLNPIDHQQTVGPKSLFTPTTPKTRDQSNTQNHQQTLSLQQDLERGRLFSSPVLRKLVSYHPTKSDSITPTKLTRKVKVALILLSTILEDDNCPLEIASKVVQHIGTKTPLLIKTVLLLNNDRDRDWALKTRIMHCLVISKYSVGTWLTDMLQNSNRLVSDAALDYLKLVSDADFFDQDWSPEARVKEMTTYRGSSKRNIHSRRQLLTSDTSTTNRQQLDQQKELYSAVSRLPG
jgi:hypothetical protein